MNLEIIWNGVLAGVVYSLSGYLKNKPEGQTLDEGKLVYAVYLGAASGLLTALFNIQMDQAQQIVLQLGLVALLKNFVDGAAKWLSKYESKIFGVKK